MVWSDCLRGMRKLADNHVTAIVTDPPYGLGFMGKGWDKVMPSIEIWQEALRVLKPGGLALVFGGTRTYHRLACSLEDAGFVIRDCFSWLYGTGFPKSLDISKAIDKAQGTDVTSNERWKPTPHFVTGERKTSSGNSKQIKQAKPGLRCLYEPATDAAKLWHGYGTALKPAWEPILVAMKPLDGTFAQNALEHGVAGINVDAGRIGATGKVTDNGGRWPANVLLDEEAAAQLDEQSGILKSGKAPDSGFVLNTDKHRNSFGKFEGHRVEPTTLYGDSGGASRFFYVAKASKADRGAGNSHPTVKPVKLMRHLVRLVRMPDNTLVLDPFAGSGSTLVACALEGLSALGFEREREFVSIARRRLAEGLFE